MCDGHPVARMLLSLLRATLLSAALAQPASNMTATPLFEMCSAPGLSCAKTQCCNRPGWSCMTLRKDSANKICRKHPPGVPMCAGDADWSCPMGDMCAKPFGDCRTSLCCQPLDSFRGKKNVHFECMRRPKLYYAQCRPPNPDGSRCKDSDDWMCPGWDHCKGAYEECTTSRCCKDAGFSCYLNASALDAGSGWHAFCRPTMIDAETGESACHIRGRWLCPKIWMEHVHEAVELAEWYVVEEPAEVVAAGLIIMIVVAVAALICCLIHRRRMHQQLKHIERELDAARANRRDAATKKRGEGEGAALRDTVAIESGSSLGEESPERMGVLPDASAQVVGCVAPAPADQRPVEEVVVQATWNSGSACSGIQMGGGAPLPPSHSRDLALKAARAEPPVVEIVAGVTEGGRGGNAARAMAALQARGRR